MSWNYKKYLELCSVLTSRSDEPNYEEIVEELMIMLKIKAIDKTDKLFHEKDITKEEYHQIMDNIEVIFENKLSDHHDSGTDKKNINYIGFINIILLQCVLAFTERYSQETFIELDYDFPIYNALVNLGTNTWLYPESVTGSDTGSVTGSDTGSDIDMGSDIEPWTNSLRLTKYIKQIKSSFSDIFLSILLIS